MSSLAASRTYDLAPFDAVSVAQGVTAIVEVGGAQAIRAEAASEATLDRLDLRVDGNRLHIGVEGNFLAWLMDLGRSHDIVVHVTVPGLVAGSASSGARLQLRHPAAGAITLEASSGGTVEAEIRADGGVVLTASSGGYIDARGAGRQLVASASSGGTVDAVRLQPRDATADASSGGLVHVAAEASLVASASSGGRIRVVGQPRTITTNTSSGGSVRLDG